MVNMQNSCRRAFGIVPDEIVELIFSFLDGAPPSTEKLYLQPYIGLTSEEHASIKNVSRVCRRWRDMTFARLFRHCRILLGCNGRMRSDIRNSTVADFINFAQTRGLTSAIKSVSIEFEATSDADMDACADSVSGAEQFDLSTLFRIVNPQRFTVLAPPQVLGELLGRPVSQESRWSFHMPYHLLSLSQTLEPEASFFKLDAFLLFARPWTTLLLNEGSSKRIWGEYHNESLYASDTPSVLPGSTSLVQGTSIRSLTFVAIFPLTEQLTRLFALFDNLDYLGLHVTPGPQTLRTDAWQGAWFDSMKVNSELESALVHYLTQECQRYSASWHEEDTEYIEMLKTARVKTRDFELLGSDKTISAMADPSLPCIGANESNGVLGWSFKTPYILTFHELI